MGKPFRSLYTRQREFESRVHTDLTERSRERLSVITDVDSSISDRAFSELAQEVGTSPLAEFGSSPDHHAFILRADTVLVLSYLEHYIQQTIEEVTEMRGGLDVDTVREMLGKMDEVFITEGILWEIEENDEGDLIFRPIESESMEDVDSKVQGLAEEEPWDEALKGYNDAFERYLSGDFDELIPKKLYYSVEEVLKIICVDEEGWTDNRKLTHADYLDMLKEHGVYDAHGVTATELGDLLDSLERMVAKISDDRHQRHAYHDRTYATLLIHQVGAYLYFLINRYEDYALSGNS